MFDQTPPAARRHDLDALRAFAMLLGIALHATLAYIGAGWVVSDERSSLALGMLVNAVHGFRMPLFFLLSGFFTAMLWRRQGVAYLASQRARRILLPLVVGCLTIVPAMWAVSGWAISQRTGQIRDAATTPTTGERASAPDIWTAAAAGDLASLRTHTTGSELIDAPDPTFGVTPLGWTAIKDQPAAAKYLLDVGAKPSARYTDGNTPLHTACFFGRAEVAEHLLHAGADRTIRSAAGDQPIDAMRHNQQITEYIANMLKLPVDFEKVAAGRERIRAMMENSKSAQSGVSTPPRAGGSPDDADESVAALVARLQGDVFFHHLWFLWFLCWLTAGFVIVVLVIERLTAIKLPSVLFGSPLCLLWVVPLTMLTQAFMHAGGALPGFGADTSAGLIPIPHVLVYYATFFGFGAIMHRVRGSRAQLGRGWWIYLPLAMVVFPFAMMFGYNAERAADVIANEDSRRWLSSLLQVLYAWLMIFGLLGLFEKMLAKDRPWVRYLSDSSYWLYLVHLPLIILGQGLLLRTDLPPLVEFGVLTIVTTGVLLISYHLLVRYTPIGTVLNGKRTRKPRSAARIL